jgi:hypothetical protein
MSPCKHDDCTTEIVTSGHGKGGRPRLYCPDHSSAKTRKQRSRADDRRLPCGCKASGRYARCPQHREHTDAIRWADPDQTAEGYAVPPMTKRRFPLADQAPEVAEYAAAKMLTSHEVGPNRVSGQWMTQRHSDGSPIPVIGQTDGYWDRDLVWHDSPSDWGSELAFKVASPVARGVLIRRAPDWPWATEAEAPYCVSHFSQESRAA